MRIAYFKSLQACLVSEAKPLAKEIRPPINCFTRELGSISVLFELTLTSGPIERHWTDRRGRIHPSARDEMGEAEIRNRLDAEYEREPALMVINDNRREPEVLFASSKRIFECNCCQCRRL